MATFNKLVRDKIPAIIRAHGEIPQVRIIEDDGEYLKALLQKDIEEGLELAQDTNVEELADKLEVLYAIGKAIGYSPEKIEQARSKKYEDRGGFEARIFLESTE